MNNGMPVLPTTRQRVKSTIPPVPADGAILTLRADEVRIRDVVMRRPYRPLDGGWATVRHIVEEPNAVSLVLSVDGFLYYAADCPVEVRRVRGAES